jgi:hypothetical protein
VDPKKIEAMQHWPRPKTPKIVCDFLGLMGYYRKFFHNYVKIVAPISTLLKKNALSWNPSDPGGYQWPPTYSNWLKTVCL